MRLYIAESETPNALTAETLRKSRKGEDVIEASDLKDMLEQLLRDREARRRLGRRFRTHAQGHVEQPRITEISLGRTFLW